jgi:hypothetical protein
MRNPGDLVQGARKLAKLFALAQTPDGTAPFSWHVGVDALLSGTPIEQVAPLVGHSSIKGHRAPLRALG